jgi:hypothetical protein
MKKRILESKRNECLGYVTLEESVGFNHLASTIVASGISPTRLRMSSPAILNSIKKQIAALVEMQRQLITLQQIVKNKSLVFWPQLIKKIVPASKCYDTASSVIAWLQNYHDHCPAIVNNTIFFEHIAPYFKQICDLAELRLHANSKNILLAKLEELILKVHKNYNINPLSIQQLDDLLTELLDHKHGRIVILKYMLEEEYERLGGLDRKHRR